MKKLWLLFGFPLVMVAALVVTKGQIALKAPKMFLALTNPVETMEYINSNKLPQGNFLQDNIQNRDDQQNDALMDEKVDIFIGNHVGNNDTVGKGKRITETENPFIDPNAFKIFLQERKQLYLDLIEEESKK